MLSRREFLAATAGLAPLSATAAVLGPLEAFSGAAPGLRSVLAVSSPRARYWATPATAGVDCLTCHEAGVDRRSGHRHQPATVSCLLCAQRCVIEPGARGRCRARENVKGELRSLVYGRPAAIHVDPIEKKPFYHFLPGSAAFSIGTAGCPLRCKFCQNWELSQASPEDHDAPYVAPAKLAEAAKARGAQVVAFTYNEPTVFAEYMLDVATEAHRRGLRSVLVSCGFMTEIPLKDLCGALDAIKIDLKGFSEQFYHEVSGASLAPVLRSITQVARSGVHLEIVNLVVPTLNDGERSIADLARWLASEAGPDVPIHFTRFHPDFQLRNLPPTPVATLERARAVAIDAGLRYVYVGNVPGHAGNHTYCPACHKVIVERSAFFVTALHVRDGRCAFCRERIAGVWS
jgi:pyruvate formate lyase activating enzyme